MYEPSNELERKLKHAAEDPVMRPEFYRLLLEEDIFVIGFTDLGGEGVKTIPSGAHVSIIHWEKNDGTPFIPFFTSLESLRRSLNEESNYIALPARNFFEMTLGSVLILNPSAPYSKEFVPAEIQAMLGTGMNIASRRRVVQQETQVLLGQPANYPSAMISALTVLLARHRSVKAGYLCLMHDPSSSDKPSLLIGLDGDEDLGEAMKEAASVAVDTVPEGEIVEFAVLKRGEPGISAYMFDSVTPFYERSWGSKLRSLFAS